jgi:hypothetical protein
MGMRLPYLKAIVAVTLCLALVACAAARKLRKLDQGMTPSEVISVLGEPEIAREPMTNKHGQIMELWHYELYNNHIDAEEAYFLYFYEGKLVKWGKATDWPRERIYKMKFK